MTKYKESERKQKGQYFTPDTVADEMVNMTPDEWWSAGILEPTCGNGNLVIRILNEKLIHGLTAEQALSTTFANEIDKKYADECTERVRQWAIEHNVDTQWKCMNEDAKTYDFSQITYDYVWTNLPFGSWISAQLPKQIAKNVVKSEAILISKATAFKKFIKEYKIVDFPGIIYKCQISHYDLNCKDSKSWLDKYRHLMDDECKWVVTDNSYTHVCSLLYGHGAEDPLIGICSRDYYDKKGRLPGHCILLKLTDEEFNKLTTYSDPAYNEYNKEFRCYTLRRNHNILYGFINKALS